MFIQIGNTIINDAHVIDVTSVEVGEFGESAVVIKTAGPDTANEYGPYYGKLADAIWLHFAKQAASINDLAEYEAKRTTPKDLYIGGAKVEVVF